MAYRKRNLRRKSRKVTRRPYVRRAKRASKKPTFAKKVMAVVNRSAEHKSNTGIVALQPSALQPTTTTLGGNIVVLTPSNNAYALLNIAIGNSQSQRIGSKVHTVKNIVRFSAVPNPYSASTNITPTPLVMRVWFFRDKTSPISVPAYTQITGTSADFVTNGSSDLGLISQNYLDFFYRINNDRYQYLKHCDFKLGFASDSGTGSSAAAQSYNNNDFKYQVKKTIDLTKYTPKTIDWEIGNSLPTSKNIIMLVQVQRADGQQYPLAALPCTMYVEQEFVYTDM